MLGWVNRIGGIIFYALLYSIVLSIFLFYAVQLHLIKNETITASSCYSFIKPLGPGIIDKLGIIIPFFKDMFSQLQHFFGEGQFGELARRIALLAPDESALQGEIVIGQGAEETAGAGPTNLHRSRIPLRPCVGREQTHAKPCHYYRAVST